jgi:tRNA threonylcarbamoyladenosine biosynthesis protein TsaB
VLILAFDTATDAATIALVRDGDVLGERPSRAVKVLEDANALLAGAGVELSELEGLVAGTGPGSYTGLRMGLITARTLAFSLGIPAAGVSTLAALAHGAAGGIPVIDARRGEVFTTVEGEARCVRPEDVPVVVGGTYVGDGAVRYREALARGGAIVPPDDAEVHVPWARHHAALARDFDGEGTLEPIYLRVPDAERAIARR